MRRGGRGRDGQAPADARDGAAAAAGAFPLAEPHLPAGPGQPPIIARRAWAGDLEPRFPPVYGDVRLAFVHHSVTANGYSSGEVPAILRSIYYFHTRVRGWNDIGYNFAVDAYGRIWEARAGGIDQAVVGAQAGGYNVESFGAVLLGDFEATLPTSAARRALAHLVAWKLALHGVPISGRVTVEVDPSDAFYTRFRPGQLVSLPRIAGHRDGCTTDCPGDDMYFNGMPPLRRAVAQLTGRQVNLTLEAGPPPRSKYSRAPYAIAPGTKIQPARYLQLASVRLRAGDVLPVHGYLRSFAGVSLRSAPVVVQEVSSSRSTTHEASVARAVTHPDGLWVARPFPADQPARAGAARRGPGGGVRAAGDRRRAGAGVDAELRGSGRGRRDRNRHAAEAPRGAGGDRGGRQTAGRVAEDRRGGPRPVPWHPAAQAWSILDHRADAGRRIEPGGGLAAARGARVKTRRNRVSKRREGFIPSRRH